MLELGLFATVKQWLQRIAVACVLVSGASSLIHAQETATILGTVRDASGAAVAGTNISARNTDTQQVRTAITEEDGSYRIPGLLVGNYEVRAEHQGFEVAVHAGLVLTVDLQAVVNLTLQVGSVSQSVEVTGEAPLVNTTTSSTGGLVDSERMSDLPMNGRNYIDLSLMQVGVTNQANGTHNIGYVGSYVVSNGATVRSNNYLLDGANMTNAWGVSSASVTNSTLGVDGIREYKVISSSIPAEYGMTMGSQMTMVSKSGTNSFHGDVFEYLRNSALDAASYFDSPVSSGGHRLPEFRRNNFGAAIGGPIKRNKIFFHTVYEGLRSLTGITEVNNVVPGACEQLVPGTFNLANPSACATAVKASPATFPKSVIPQLAPFLALDALYPANVTPNATTNQLSYVFNQPAREDFGQFRSDQTLSPKDSLFERWTVEDSFQPIPGAFPGWYTAAQDRTQFVTISEDHIFSPTVLNTARMHFSRTSFYWHGIVPDIAAQPNLDCIPNFTTCGSGISGLAGPSTPGNRRHKQNLYTWSDDVFYTRGKHSFKFGGLLNSYLQVITNGGGCCGVQSFSSMANFLTGTAILVSENAGPSYERTYKYDTLGMYAQDDFRVTSRLTLNLGLRYEFETRPYENHGEWSVIKDLAHDTGYTVTKYVDLNPTLRNFSPRVGFAWDVRGDGKTAIRGGFAQLYDVGGITAFTLQTQNSTPPFSNRLEVLAPPSGAKYTLPFVFPGGTTGASGNILAPRPTDWNLKQSRMLMYNLTLERQVPWNTSISIGYGGSRGYNLANTQEGNPSTPQGVPGPNGTCVARPVGQAVNTSSMIDGQATACWLGGDPRINPNFGTMDLFTDRAHSWYNSLQVSIAKRLSQGLEFQSSYTYSKTIDEQAGAAFAENTTSQAADGLDPFNIGNERGPTVFDVANVWKFNVIYNVPSIRSNGMLSKFTNGWRLASITTVESGFPFSIGLNTERSLSGVQGGAAGVDRPNYASNRSIYSITHGVSTGCNGVAPGTPLGTPTLYFDPCAFTIPDQGFLGNVGRNTIRGPNLRNLDFSITKDTSVKWLGEAGAVEFRAEAFNIFNHPNFSLPIRTAYNGALASSTVPVNGLAETAREAPFTGAGTILNGNGVTGVVTGARQIQLALKVLF